MTDTIAIMYNGCHGEFKFSKAALEEYKRRKSKIYPPRDHSDSDDDGDDISRTDKLMVEICEELGEKANSRRSLICIERIPRRFKRYYSIEASDGVEHILIDYQTYKLSAIRQIISDETTTSEVKEKLTRAIINERCTFSISD
jgi:hypothetical protein